MKMVHVTIHTAKLEESIQFYQEIAELKITLDLREKGGKKIVFLANGSEDTCIELIEDNEQPYAGYGLSIGFHVEDVKEARINLEAKGCSPSPLISPAPGTEFFFVKDPNGVSIQFI